MNNMVNHRTTKWEHPQQKKKTMSPSKVPKANLEKSESETLMNLDITKDLKENYLDMNNLQSKKEVQSNKSKWQFLDKVYI